jgi:DNA polymerase III subunit epsilon
MTDALTLAPPDTLLADRAADFLAAGPADAQTLISYVCQIPGAPRTVAEHMATALFAGHTRFARCTDGRWELATAPRPVSRVAPATLDGASFIVVDVETTGSRALGGDRVTEVAAVQVRGGSVTTLFESLVNPERPIPPSVTRLTNITSAMVRRAPRFSEVCDQLLGVLEGQVFVGHNAGFDWRFLSMEIQRVTGRALQGRKLCTVRLARALLPNLKRRSLDHLSVYYGVENTARHRAGGDAVATAKVLVRMLREARSQGCAAVEDLFRLAARGNPRKRRGRRPPAMPRPVSIDTTA